MLTYFDHLVEVIIAGGNSLSNTLQSSTASFCTKPSYYKAQAKSKPKAIIDSTKNNLTLSARTKEKLGFYVLIFLLVLK